MRSALRPSCSAAMSWWALGCPAATAHSWTVTGLNSVRSSSSCKSCTRRFSVICSQSALSSCGGSRVKHKCENQVFVPGE